MSQGGCGYPEGWCSGFPCFAKNAKHEAPGVPDSKHKTVAQEIAKKERQLLVPLQNYAKQIRVKTKRCPVAQFIGVNLIIVATHRQSSR